MSSDDHDATLYPFTPAPPPPPTSRRPSRRSRITKTAAGLALVLGTGTGVAVVALATSGAPSPASAAARATATDGTTTTTTPQRRSFGGGPRRFGSGPFGFAGPGAGLNGVIHGSYTVKGPDGSYETIDTQYGTAEAVSSTSITVKSADGFSQTYVVGPSTVVDADSSGITAVALGDEVTIQALVSGSTITAERVTDLTQLQANKKSWAPDPPTPSAPATPGLFHGPFGQPSGSANGTGWDGGGPGPSAA
jgi:hypothetical protein